MEMNADKPIIGCTRCRMAFIPQQGDKIPETCGCYQCGDALSELTKEDVYRLRGMIRHRHMTRAEVAEAFHV